MRAFHSTGLLFVLLAIGLSDPARLHAATFSNVDFDQMVDRSEIIVQGRVVMLESIWAGSASAPAGGEQSKESQPPRKELSRQSKQASEASPAPPVSVGTEGGQMIFTRVVLETLEDIKGSPGGSMEFLVAGGSLDGRAVIVPGLPQFEEGERYVLFFREGYQAAADPVVGVNQGFFHVVQHPTSGQEVLLNADADYVLGIEHERVMLRNKTQASAGPQRIGPPQPSDAGVESGTSPEVERYWSSKATPMTVSEFTDAVRARLNANFTQ